VIPTRNERGNIEAAIKRIPSFAKTLEVIFVEGHSSTWDEFERVARASPQHQSALNWMQ
jgi:hypothetical protein